MADFQRKKKIKKYDDKWRVLGVMPSYVLRNISCKTFIQENKGYQTKKK